MIIYGLLLRVGRWKNTHRNEMVISNLMRSLLTKFCVVSRMRTQNLRMTFGKIFIFPLFYFALSRAKRTCFVNAGLSHSCDYKNALAAVDEGRFFTSDQSPGKK